MKLLTALLAVAALVAGCGGSSGGGSSTNSSQPPASSSSTASTSSSTASAAASTTQPTFASNSNCQQLTDLGKKYLAQVQAAAASGGQASFSTVLSAEQAMADASPSAIHGDAEYVVHSLSGLFSKLASAGYKPGTAPTASQLAVIYPLIAGLKSAHFTAAMNHIDSWIHSNCHGVS